MKTIYTITDGSIEERTTDTERAERLARSGLRVTAVTQG